MEKASKWEIKSNETKKNVYNNALNLGLKFILFIELLGGYLNLNKVYSVIIKQSILNII